MTVKKKGQIKESSISTPSKLLKKPNVITPILKHLFTHFTSAIHSSPFAGMFSDKPKKDA